MMITDFKVNRMNATDISEVKRIEEVCRLSPWSKEDYRAEMARQDSIALIAKKGDEFIGFIIARLISTSDHTLSIIRTKPFKEDNKLRPEICLESDIEIMNIGVLPEFRRNSVGKMLLGSLLENLESFRSVNVFLEVRQSNTGAVEFYTKLDFTVIGRRKNFYSNPIEDALLMKRRIENP